MRQPRVLFVHNYYQQSGGEDVAFAAEKKLLEDHGHETLEFIDDNERINELGGFTAASQTIWSKPTYRAMAKLLKDFQPNIAHFHNTFLLISPSAYFACHDLRVPVVQTLHNYRLLCPSAVLYRDGVACEKCLGKKVALPGVWHRCYHNSRSQTAVVAAMLSIHHALDTWRTKVDVYIALSEFARTKFIQGGLPRKKIVVKPNFVQLDGISLQAQYQKPDTVASGSRYGERYEDFALFVGRLSEEKGIRTLLAAWKSLAMPLKIAGDGPLREELLQSLSESKSKAVEYLGSMPHAEALRLMKRARLLIFPSEWYEGFPMTIVEAFACSLPVLSSDIGSQAEIIKNGYSGLHFRAGDVNDLREKIQWCLQNPMKLLRMGENARHEYEEQYTPTRNYQMMMDIYSQILDHRT